jgi:hypothetical protein
VSVIATCIDIRLRRIVAAQPFPLLFAAISGAHLYGFPSPDSDFDLRGAHVLPVERALADATLPERPGAGAVNGLLVKARTQSAA